MDVKEILKHVDHTLLKQTATWEDIKQICDDGIKYGCASVCIPQTYVNHAAHYVAEQQHYGFGQLPICTVIGFPNGYTPSGIKCMEAESAVADGATEIDMVIPTSAGSGGPVRQDRSGDQLCVKISCHGNILKVIERTACSPTKREKIGSASRLNSTPTISRPPGFAGGGATPRGCRPHGSPHDQRQEDQGRGGIASDLGGRRRISSSSAPTASARPALSRPSRSQTKGELRLKGEGSICRLRTTARKGDFAKTVLMPGDPLRANSSPKRFLDEPKLVNNVRGVQGYTALQAPQADGQR